MSIIYKIAFILLSASVWAGPCVDMGGEEVTLQAVYNYNKGFKQRFCRLHIDNGIAVIGLETLESKLPNIAASFVRTHPEILENDPLWQGRFSNPSHNVCRNLGGSAIGFSFNGSFSDDTGEYDICTFGDASMISAWTLIYILNHRTGYELIQQHIPSPALTSYLTQV